MVSDLVRRPVGSVRQKIALIGDKVVGTSIVVAAEARFGAAKAGSARLVTQLERVLAELVVLPLTEPSDTVYARTRADLEAVGTPIGANDLLIATHALALDCILVTDNEREFRRVPGLRVENWLRAD
jgi:tRNA(fMet)-specific endonuclease VapC